MRLQHRRRGRNVLHPSPLERSRRLLLSALRSERIQTDNAGRQGDDQLTRWRILGPGRRQGSSRQRAHHAGGRERAGGCHRAARQLTS